MESIISMVVGLVILGGILYVVFRPKGDSGTGGKDAYYYIVSFIALAILYWAVADVFRVIFEQQWRTSTTYYYNSGNTADAVLRKLSLRLSTIIVGLPVWAFHWFKASRKPEAEIDRHSRKSYAVAVLVLTSLIVLGMGTGLVYQGINALLGLGENAGQVLAYMIPYTLLAAAIWVMHFREMKASER